MTVYQDTKHDTKVEPKIALARRREITAYRLGRYVLIVAVGDLPSPGYEVNIEPSPLRIFPQQYNLFWHERPGIWPDVLVPYVHSELVVYPEGQSVVTVHHADGQDEVGINEAGADLGRFAAVVADQDSETAADEAVGLSQNLRFDEAFADALANLPHRDPTHPDELTTVTVTETGGVFGGIAGFHHLYVRVSRTVT